MVVGVAKTQKGKLRQRNASIHNWYVAQAYGGLSALHGVVRKCAVGQDREILEACLATIESVGLKDVINAARIRKREAIDEGKIDYESALYQ